MSRLDEIVNECGYACCNCPYDDCVVDETEKTEEGEVELTKSQVYYQKNKERFKESQKRFFEKHPEKRREYYEKGRERYKARRKFTQKERSRVQRRARAVDNYDYLQSMDKYELAEFLATKTGRTDKEIMFWLNKELIGGELNNE